MHRFHRPRLSDISESPPAALPLVAIEDRRARADEHVTRIVYYIRGVEIGGSRLQVGALEASIVAVRPCLEPYEVRWSPFRSTVRAAAYPNVRRLSLTVCAGVHIPIINKRSLAVDRRTFLKSVAAAGAAAFAGLARLEAALPQVTITKVRIFQPPNLNQTFNQSNMVVTVETSNPNLIGVGEGGTRDTLEQCAGRLIGKNPFSIERCWQDMYRAWFYPPGREKIHALGALDLALWDLKGKALDVPVYDLLGGMNRNYLECYATGGGGGGRHPGPASGGAPCKPAIAFSASTRPAGGGNTFNSRTRVNQVIQDAKACREGVGENGDWMIDFHQRFDYPDCAAGLPEASRSSSLTWSRTRCAPNRFCKTSRACGT